MESEIKNVPKSDQTSDIPIITRESSDLTVLWIHFPLEPTVSESL